ncbi:type II toxin-antitoxin system MqsA family antitoxin [Candidatus Poribacteria bacterium]|nr:type II toxin-antitoxin system MqsA family antitoxin [Candidatus Poribacteria bacterium]
MKCVFCGGRVESQKVTFVYDYDNNYFFVENVPAEVCVQCGEKTYSPEVTDELIRLAKKELKPVKTIQVPVFEYVDQVWSWI